MLLALEVVVTGEGGYVRGMVILFRRASSSKGRREEVLSQRRVAS